MHVKQNYCMIGCKSAKIDEKYRKKLKIIKKNLKKR